jgi:hypothetical protein
MPRPRVKKAPTKAVIGGDYVLMWGSTPCPATVYPQGGISFKWCGQQWYGHWSLVGDKFILEEWPADAQRISGIYHGIMNPMTLKGDRFSLIRPAKLKAPAIDIIEDD